MVVASVHFCTGRTRAKIYGGEGVALGVTGPEVPHTDVTRIIADAAVL